MTTKQIAIIGGGPAGLMAADDLSASGHSVTVYEAMPTVGRKFLLAGKSGLNLTHSEDFSRFAGRFGAASERLRPALDAFTPDDLRTWADVLGTKTFVGTSGRVFPEVMKASPLLRAWLARLEAQGVMILKRHRWIGFDGDLTGTYPTEQDAASGDDANAGLPLLPSGRSAERMRGDEGAPHPWRSPLIRPSGPPSPRGEKRERADPSEYTSRDHNPGYIFDTPEGMKLIRPDATLLALGGASWPRLGSDAAWLPWLQAKNVEIHDFQPANCGFDVAWSDIFRERFAGAPVKSVTATSDAGTIQGEFVISKHGIEGSLVYAHAASLRDRLAATGRAELVLDLMPGRSEDRLAHDLAKQSPKESLSNRLRKGAGLDAVKAALVRECGDPTLLSDPTHLAHLIKALPIPLLRPRPIAEAISSAGGIAWNGIDENFMLTALPGTFIAGEMLDWEAPTGGYLLTACLATGRAAARGIEAWLSPREDLSLK